MLLSYTQTIINDKIVSYVSGFIPVVKKEDAQEFSEWKNCESVPYTSAHYCYTHCRVGSFADILIIATPFLSNVWLNKSIHRWKVQRNTGHNSS